MLQVHHLNDSRSQRILWLLEELGLDYELVTYQRDPATRLAPDSLKAIHPLGKSPVLEDGDLVLAESGAIIEYVVRTHGKGRLAPDPASPDYVSYLHWMHYAEGSAMLPLLLALYVGLLGPAGAPLQPRIQSEMANHLGYMNAALEGKEFFVGKELTAADIQMIFVTEAANASQALGPYPNLAAHLARMHARPAYQRAIERGGPFQLRR